MDKHLVLFCSRNGQTEKICQFIVKQLALKHIFCELSSLNEKNIDFSSYKSALFAMPVHYGKHDSKMVKLLNEQQASLTKMITGILSVNLTARKLDKDTPETNPYYRKLLKKLQWQPNFMAVVAGALQYPNYKFYDRWLIRLIMWCTKGPVDTKISTEFTKWDIVKCQASDYGEIIS